MLKTWDAENLALQIALKSQAEVNLLHIVPPVDLDYPTSRVASEHWRDLINTDTMLGRNLRKAVETVQAAGLVAHVDVRSCGGGNHICPKRGEI
jgi:hypothetical protein